jgi:hypothetical protein
MISVQQGFYEVDCAHRIEAYCLLLEAKRFIFVPSGKLEAKLLPSQLKQSSCEDPTSTSDKGMSHDSVLQKGAPRLQTFANLWTFLINITSP